MHNRGPSPTRRVSPRVSSLWGTRIQVAHRPVLPAFDDVCDTLFFLILSDYMHAQNVSFGLYTAESKTTCAGYPASEGMEQLDAQTFASWGVDYLKVDGCGDQSYYQEGYHAMGQALVNSGRNIVYSCHA